jgi:hypothetical protein
MKIHEVLGETTKRGLDTMGVGSLIIAVLVACVLAAIIALVE